MRNERRNHLRLAEAELEGELAGRPHAHVLKDKVGAQVALEVGNSVSVADEVADEGAELFLLASFGGRIRGRLSQFDRIDAILLTKRAGAEEVRQLRVSAKAKTGIRTSAVSLRTAKGRRGEGSAINASKRTHTG